MKEKYLFIKMAGYLLLLLFIIYITFACHFYLSRFNSAHQTYENLNCEYLRIKIYGSSSTGEGNTISGSFSIIDSNGNEIAVIERSWSGAYLAVEFVQSNFNGKYFIFPTCIYGKNRIIEGRNERKNGIKLEKYYNDYGQCMLLGFGSTYKQRKDLYKLSTFANENFPFITFGINKTISIDLSSCKTNRYYSIQSDENGVLFVTEI